MIELVEKLLKEWDTIKSAPRAFVLAAVVTLGIFYACFHLYYSEKLSRAKNRATAWKESADYWKERAERPPAPEETKPVETQPTPLPPTRSSPADKASKTPTQKPIPPADAVPSANPPTQSAPGGINIGRDNTGTATVNNNIIAPPQRALTPAQKSGLASCLKKAGPFKLYIAFAQHNFEAQKYSDDFVSALNAGGWTVETYPVPLTETRVGSGIHVEISTDDSNSLPNDVLSQCLVESHLKPHSFKTSILPSGSVLLYVGVPE